MGMTPLWFLPHFPSGDVTVPRTARRAALPFLQEIPWPGNLWILSG